MCTRQCFQNIIYHTQRLLYLQFWAWQVGAPTPSLKLTLAFQTKIWTWKRGFSNPKIPCHWREHVRKIGGTWVQLERKLMQDQYSGQLHKLTHSGLQLRMQLGTRLPKNSLWECSCIRRRVHSCITDTFTATFRAAFSNAWSNYIKSEQMRS